MYVGGTDIRALHHMIYEVVDNSIDEALAGRCSYIEVVLHGDGAVTVNDDGGGIPVGINKDSGISTLETVMTRLNAGGKFSSSAYKVSGGLHGVGISAVNALSHRLITEVRRDGKVYTQEYSEGAPQSRVEMLRQLEPDEPTGTKHTFLPDFSIMERNEFSFNTLAQRFREMAFVTRGVTIHLRDERVKPFPREMTFYFEGGLRSFVRYLDRNRPWLHDPVAVEREIQVEFEDNNGGIKTISIGVEVAFQFTDSSTTTELYFANTIHTPDGGSHQAGFRAALTRTINLYARKAGLLKEKDPNFSSNDTLEGLTAIVSVKHPNPQFESQTKVKLMNPEVQGVVSQATSDVFMEFLEVNPRDAKRIIDQCMTSMRARDAAKKARDLVRRGANLLENTTLPGKLADCSEQDPSKCELYIVEGDSAGGSAKQGRDRHFQAILPLRGKILNTERARLNKILDNNEVKALISALGVGIGDDFNLEGLRYGRVIIMSVAGDEPTLVAGPTGQAELVKIGDFIDDCMDGRRNAADYQVMSFDLATHATRFRPLKAVIRHGHCEPMYRLTTRYHRTIKVTSSHSVFVLEDSQVRLKKGNEVRPGDVLVASKKLPRPSQPITQIDLLKTLADTGLTHALYLKGETVRHTAGQRVLKQADRPELWNEPRVLLSVEGWQSLIQQRQAVGLSQMQLAASIGVKQPITISHWERAINRPVLSHFKHYLDAIGWTDAVDYALLPSKLDEWLDQDDSSNNARWRKVSDYKAFDDFTTEELDQLDDAVQIVPQAHTDRAFGRYLPISRELFWLLGWYVAEGTLSAHQVSLNLGEKDVRFISEISAAIEEVFGETPRRYNDPDSKGIKLYFHSVMAARLLQSWGLDGPAHHKRIPAIVFSLPEDLQLAFLESYFLGDGTTGGQNLSWTSNSADLKDGLLYLLGQLGLVAGYSEHQPSTKPDAPIQTRHPYYSISLCGKPQLEATRSIWQRHTNAPLLAEHLARPAHKSPDYVTIGQDLIGLEVLSAEEIAPVGEYVYDFSVQDDENFICGTGGLCAHNTDADVDGAHIRTLLLTFFFRYMSQLITESHLYIAQPPLYLVSSGKEKHYAYTEDERDQVIKTLKNPDKANIQRYKGLGEMNPEQLWETTMDPANRTLLLVTIEDAAEADRVFDMLMGSSVPPRRRFITTHAKKATLDI
jgi:DNA gyrase subunit B